MIDAYETFKGIGRLNATFLWADESATRTSLSRRSAAI